MQVFFTTNEEVATEIKAVTKHLFDRCTQFVSKSAATPLDQLYVDGFDADQIWEQLRLQNEPLVAELSKRIRGLNKNSDLIRLFPSEKKASQHSEEEDSEAEEQAAEGSDSDDESEQKETDEELAHSDSDAENDDADDDAVTKKAKASEKKKSSKKKKKARDVAEDGFFDWDEMDKAAEEEEEFEGDDDEMEGDFDGDDDLDDDMDDDDEDDEDEEEESDAGDAKDMTYKDFFGDPEQESAENDDEEDDEEGDESDEEMQAADDDDEEEYPSLKRAKPSDEPVDDDDLAERGIMSSFQRQRQRLQSQIKELEEEALGDKPWLLKGEVRSGARPENSLLEAVLDYDRPVKVAPVVTVEVSVALEEMIKKRILEDDFDDVIRKFAPNEGDEKNKLEEVSMEKSKEGLGEIYEKEYMKTAMGFEADDESKQDQEEIEVMFKSLCWKLDALSNYQFTPKPIVKELQVKPSVPAIAMEEVVPMSVSDANLKAPEEIYEKKRKRGEKVLQSKDEMSQNERKALRNAKKQSRRKEKRQRDADERLVAKLNPGLGNKYEKKKLMESLASAKNVTTGKEIEGSTKQFSNSKEFFSRLQDEVQSEIQKRKESS